MPRRDNKSRFTDTTAWMFGERLVCKVSRLPPTKLSVLSSSSSLPLTQEHFPGWLGDGEARAARGRKVGASPHSQERRQQSAGAGARRQGLGVLARGTGESRRHRGLKMVFKSRPSVLPVVLVRAFLYASCSPDAAIFDAAASMSQGKRWMDFRCVLGSLPGSFVRCGGERPARDAAPDSHDRGASNVPLFFVVCCTARRPPSTLASLNENRNAYEGGHYCIFCCGELLRPPVASHRLLRFSRNGFHDCDDEAPSPTFTPPQGELQMKSGTLSIVLTLAFIRSWPDPRCSFTAATRA